MDQPPSIPRHVHDPLTTCCAASANISASVSGTSAVKVPLYSAFMPATRDRHAPDHPFGAFALVPRDGNVAAAGQGSRLRRHAAGMDARATFCATWPTPLHAWSTTPMG